MKVKLKIWRQANAQSQGAMHTYHLDDVSEDMSFLEMLDVLNEKLNESGEEPIAFDSDCREGICGMCGLMINGQAHGPTRTTTCQLHMRSFADGDTITIEPWRAAAFPVLKDLCVDRRAFDRIIQAGGYISVNTGAAPDAHAMPVPKDNADRAFDAATCIGCGACAAACPNASVIRGTTSGTPAWSSPCTAISEGHRPRTVRRSRSSSSHGLVVETRCAASAASGSAIRTVCWFKPNGASWSTVSSIPRSSTTQGRSPRAWRAWCARGRGCGCARCPTASPSRRGPAACRAGRR